MVFLAHRRITVLNKLNWLCHATWFCWYKLQSCSNIAIWFMFNCQTKRKIVALFIYPETPPCWVFFLGPVIVYLFVCTIAQSRTIAVFYRTICQNPQNFLFFSRTLSEGLFKCFLKISRQSCKLPVLFFYVCGQVNITKCVKATNVQ